MPPVISLSIIPKTRLFAPNPPQSHFLLREAPIPQKASLLRGKQSTVDASFWQRSARWDSCGVRGAKIVYIYIYSMWENEHSSAG
jgi:hypothetical protein